MGISEDLIVPYNEQIVGFAGERVDTRGYVDLCTRLGTGRESEEKRLRYLVVEANTFYNVLLGRLCQNAFGAKVSTPNLTLKYSSSKGMICIVQTDQKTTRECYPAGLKMYPQTSRRKTNRSKVAMADLNPRTNTDDQLEPLRKTQSVIVGKYDS